MSRKNLLISLVICAAAGLLTLAPVVFSPVPSDLLHVAVVKADATPAPGTPGKLDLTSSMDKFATSSGMGKSGQAASGQSGLIETIGKLIQAALGLLGIILVVLVIYAGFLWMTASGNEEQVSKAKKMLSNAVIGMVIIMAAYAITAFVVSSIVAGTSGCATPPC